MKRINIIFTSINILTIATMLIQIGICYFSDGYVSASPSVSFIYAVLYIPPLVLINVMWKVICRKKEVQTQFPETPASNVLARDMVWTKRVNIIFIALNIMTVAAMLIHDLIDIQGQNLSFTQNLFGFIWIYYIIPLILINDAWFVIHMNMKKTN